MTVILEMHVDGSDIDPIGHGGAPHSEFKSAHNRTDKKGEIFIKNVVQLFRVPWEMSEAEADDSPGPEAGGKPPHCLGALTQLSSSANPPPRKPISLVTSWAASVQVPLLLQNLSVHKFEMV